MSNIFQAVNIELTRKTFKVTPRHYKSSFNKLTLVSDEYKVYCEPIEDFLIFQDHYSNDVQLAIEWLKQEVNNVVRQSLFEYNGG